MANKKISIIGSGISGLTCGYYLTKLGYEVSLFEAEDYIGGHTHTVDVSTDEESARIDTGFIVFNDWTYPNFIQLMDEIGAEYQPTEMSFSVRNDDINLEYNGHNFDTLFAQRANLFRPAFWKMLYDIQRFNSDVRKAAATNDHLTIGSYLKSAGYSTLFKDNYLLPMISAIWSMGLTSCLDFPLQFFVRFFDNHGLLNIANRPQWYTIKGGSSNYIPPLTETFKDRIHLSEPVVSVSRERDAITFTTTKNSYLFDEVIFSCHTDQILKILQAPLQRESNVLEKFTYADNNVILHTDTSHLPSRRKAWASWNYRMVDSAKKHTSLTYNMNILQRLNKNHTYLVTLNQEIDERFVLGRFSYSHPVYTTDIIAAQEQWSSISGVDRIHYCGAYWFSGFHEDGVRSGLRVCKMMEERP